MAVAVGFAAAAVLATGCGGSERERARDAAEEYVEALRDGDAEGACELLTRGAASELEDRTGDDCETAMEDILRALAEDAADLERFRVTEVNAAGNTATATIAGPGGKAITEMTREGGEWKLNAAPGG